MKIHDARNGWIFAGGRRIGRVVRQGEAWIGTAESGVKTSPHEARADATAQLLLLVAAERRAASAARCGTRCGCEQCRDDVELARACERGTP